MASWNCWPKTYAGVPGSRLDPTRPHNILDKLLQDAEEEQRYDHDEDDEC